MRAMGRLLVVATPIGNLDDLSPRAREALASAAVVYCEDTRRTGNLFARHGLTTPRVSCHGHNEHRRVDEALERLARGRDARSRLRRRARRSSPIPASGSSRRRPRPATAWRRFRGRPPFSRSSRSRAFPAVPFTFLGFPPSRRGERDRWYAAHAARPGTRVLFESPFRIVESLEALARAWGDPPVVLGRELTKLHEEVLRGRASEVARVLAARPAVKGEIVLAAAASCSRRGRNQECPLISSPFWKASSSASGRFDRRISTTSTRSLRIRSSGSSIRPTTATRKTSSRSSSARPWNPEEP